MAATYEQLINEAREIRDASVPESVTAQQLGDTLENNAEYTRQQTVGVKNYFETELMRVKESVNNQIEAQNAQLSEAIAEQDEKLAQEIEKQNEEISKMPSKEDLNKAKDTNVIFVSGDENVGGVPEYSINKQIKGLQVQGANGIKTLTSKGLTGSAHGLIIDGSELKKAVEENRGKLSELDLKTKTLNTLIPLQKLVAIQENKFLLQSNRISGISNNYRCVVYPITGGDKIKIERSVTPFIWGILTEYPVAATYEVPYATGESRHVNDPNEVTAPDDAKYLVINIQGGEGVFYTPDHVYINGFDYVAGVPETILSEFKKLKEKNSEQDVAVKDLKDKLDNLVEKKLEIKEIDTNKGNQLYLISKRLLTTNSAYGSSELMSVEGIFNLAIGCPGTVYYIVVFDAAGNVIGGYNDPDGSSWSGNSIRNYTVDSDDILTDYPEAASVMICGRNTVSDTNVTVTLTKPSKIDDIENRLSDIDTGSSKQNAIQLDGGNNIVFVADKRESSSDAYISSNRFEIKGDFKINIGCPYTVYYLVVYDAKGNVLGGYHNMTEGDSGRTVKEYEVSLETIKSDYPTAKYAMISGRKDIEGTSVVMTVKGPSFIEETKERLENLEKKPDTSSVPFGCAADNLLGHTPTIFGKEYQMIICYGQSLSNGSDSKKVTDSSVDGCLMMGGNCATFNSTTLNPLSATDRQHPIISAVKSLATLYHKFFGNNKFIATSCGEGGRSIAQLSKASRIAQYSTQYDYPIGGSGKYESAFINAINNAFSATGGNVECPAIVYLQGERDYYNDSELGPQGDDEHGAYSCANDKALYKKRMLDLKNDMQADIMAKFGQTYKPIFAIYQVSGAFVKEKAYGDYMSINMAQLEFAQENDDVILLPSPYFTPEYSSGHLSTNGYRWFGEYIAKYLFKALALNSRPEPLMPTTAIVDGSNVILSIANANGKIELDNYTTSQTTNGGFELWIDGSYSVSNIKSIKIKGNDVVIESNVSLQGKSVKVCYGGAKVGGTGNIRDNDRYVSMYEYWDDSSDKGSSGTLAINYKPKDKDGNSIIGRKYPMCNWLASFCIDAL
ncbi:MAG: hypothetical protein MJZ41_06430 [Bacteroidaceae bacterium]|nr:hypothetical protein [Bacteroidaceae bacterium]